MSALISRREAAGRSSIDGQISTAVHESQRLVLVGRIGSGRACAVRAALGKSFALTEWNLRSVSTERDLEHLPECDGSGLRGALTTLQAREGGHQVLLLRDIDGCAGCPEERAIMGRLRGEAQGLSRLRVLYTASDEAFVGRHFGDPTGAFFKQAVIVQIPDLTLFEIDEMFFGRIGTYSEPHISHAVVSHAGQRAADVSLLLDRLFDRIPKGGAITPALVASAAMSIVADRRPVYAGIERSHLVARQRMVLRAIARGAQATSDRRLREATGIPHGTLTSVLRGLRERGFLLRSGGSMEFEDPYFRLYLAE